MKPHNNQEPFRLDWRGPYSLRDFIADSGLKAEFNCPGVYVWTEETSDGPRLSYVGKAGGSPSLAVRQQQHYSCMIAGLYTIPKEFRKVDQDWIPKWSDPDVAGVLLDSNRFHDLVDDGFAYAARCTVYLACLKSLAEAKSVERQLLYDLQPTGTRWGLSTPPSTHIDISHVNAAWATEEVIARAKRPVRVDG